MSKTEIESDAGEVWMPIEGFEGEYEVSNYGRVRTLNFFRTTKDGKQYPVKSRLLKQYEQKGYLHVNLARNGRYKRYRVHRLVARVFVANPDDKPDVNHIDCNKANNRFDNLEWVTPFENTEHAIRNGLVKSDPVPMIRARRKPVIRDDGAVFQSMTDAAEAAGVMVENMGYHIRKGTKVPKDGHLYQYVSEEEREAIVKTFFPIVPFKRINPDAPTPTYARAGDAGLDLCSMETVEIEPQSVAKVGCGLAFAIPEGFYGMLAPRSGLSTSRGITLANTPSTIDSGYRGEVILPLYNAGTKPQVVEKGERVCQLIVLPIGIATMVEQDELGETERGMGGFGSTGVGERL